MSESPAEEKGSRIWRVRARLHVGNLRRLRVWILMAVAIGAVTGLGVTLLHLVIQQWVWGPLSRRWDWAIALLPIAGLILASALISRTAGRSTETTEDYIRIYHWWSGTSENTPRASSGDACGRAGQADSL